MEQQRGRVSFCAKAKSDILRIKTTNKRELIAKLGAYTRLCGSLNLNKGISFEVDNPSMARRIYEDIKALYDVSSQVQMKKFNKLGKSYKYTIIIEDKELVWQILTDTYYISAEHGFQINNAIDKRFLKNTTCKQAFLRTVFLLTGSVSNPEKAYHLEFVLKNQEFANSLIKVIVGLTINAKLIERKNSYVVYIKDGEKIVDFLTFIGCHSAILNFHNVRIIKEMRNNVNRAVNCETANIGKTVNAAIRQIESLKIIEETIGIEALQNELKEAAYLRLDNEEASLQELVDFYGNKISKSGLNHRLKKIDTIAKNILKNKGELL